MSARVQGAAAVALVSACAAGEPSESAQPLIHDSAGVQIVRNIGTAPGAGCVAVAAGASAEIPARGGTAAAGPLLFRVRGAARLSSGDIVVLNAGTQELLFYSPDGAFRRSVGGPGDGPGEFRDPAWLGRGGGDTLFVWDDRLRRLTTFDGGGTVLRSLQIPGPQVDAPPPSVSGRFDDGSLLLVPGSLVWVGGSAGVRRSPLAYYRFDPTRNQFTHLADGWSMETVIEDGGAYVLPFGKSEIAVAHGEALLLADNGAPRINYFDLHGRLVRIVQWNDGPDPVTADDRREFVRRAGRWLPPDAGTGGARFARDRPRFASIHPDRDGRVWVRDFSSFGERPAGWLVFDDAGTLQCRVPMPVPAVAWEIGPDYLLGVRTDSLGEESVVVLKLTRSPRSGWPSGGN